MTTINGRSKDRSPSALVLGMRVGPLVPLEFVRRAFDDSSDAVYSLTIAPAELGEAWEFFHFGAHEYRVEVRVDASGVIKRLAFLIEGRASHELEWADLAPSAQEAVFYELMRLTGELVEPGVEVNSDGLAPDSAVGRGRTSPA